MVTRNTLKSAEVMDILQISRPTLYRLLHKKSLHGIKAGRDWRIPEESLEKFLQGSKKK